MKPLTTEYLPTTHGLGRPTSAHTLSLASFAETSQPTTVIEKAFSMAVHMIWIIGELRCQSAERVDPKPFVVTLVGVLRAYPLLIWSLIFRFFPIKKRYPRQSASVNRRPSRNEKTSFCIVLLHHEGRHCRHLLNHPLNESDRTQLDAVRNDPARPQG